MLWLLPLLPSAAGLVLAVCRWRPALGWAAAAAAATTTAGALAATGEGAEASWGWGPRLALTLGGGGIARVMAVTVAVIATAVLVWVAATSGGHEPRPARLVGVLLVFVGAMELLVLAADLLTLLVAWELVAVCSWVLIGHRYDDRDRTQSAVHAYLTTRVGDVGLFAALGAALAGAGSFAYADLPRASSGWLAVVGGGVLLAAAAKSAQLPFAPWLFSAMAGPTPVSALLHSATMVAAGAYILARLAPALDPVSWFGPAVAGLGLATALASGLVALASLDLKRALAASTSAQYGLVLVAVGAGSTAAATGHLVAHAVFKALLFLAAGTIATVAGTLDLHRIRIGRAVRPLAAALAVGGAALAAVPPLGGAWSKEEILAAAGHRSPWLAAGVVVAGALSAAYAARLVLLVLRPPEEPAGRVAAAELSPLVALAAASVGLGALWLPGGGELVEELSGGRLAEAAAWELPASLLAIAVAGAAALALARRGRLAGAMGGGRVQGFAAGWFGLPAVAAGLVVNPVLAASRGLARIDDVVIDAGVRAATAAAAAASRLVAGVAELNVDRIVRLVAAAGLALAGAARAGDDRGVDRAVEGVATGAGSLGTRSRRLQSGFSHQYYLVVAGGVLTIVVVAVVGRS